MKGQDRRDALASYKERKANAGIYAVRSSAGGIWVGSSADLEKIQNRLWFSLRQGGWMNRRLQAAWDAAGSEAFNFETLETFDENRSTHPQGAALKQKLAAWQERLGADLA